MKTLHFISGLPRSGTTMLCSILKQNPELHTQAISSLSQIVGTVNMNWYSYETNKEYPNEQAKLGLMRGMIDGYYSHIDKSIVIDKDRSWIPLIGLLEEVLQREVKIVCMVRNPAEILSSFEKLRKESPTFFSLPDQSLRESSTIASRAYFHAGPTGSLGLTHTHIKDAVIMGYLNRLLFVDYSRYCNSPKAQTKRIYDFLNLPYFEHEFNNIEQKEVYNSEAVGYRNLHTVKPKLNRTTLNCVEYLGLELYQQYNREVFWDAWI
jgi:sulfotransferase